ncbi:histidine phosphatase family protein [Microbacterium sp. GXF7504]
MTRLLLIRHGETDWNRARRVQGVTDIPLNDTGRAQARDAAATVADMLAGEPALIVSSDLQRALETARIIAASLALPEPWTTPMLRERSYGDAEGMVFEEFHARFGAFGEAEPTGAEDRSAVRDRAVRALRDAAAETVRRADEDTTLIAVAHGGLIREVLGHASGGTVPEPGKRIPNASVHELLVTDDDLLLRSHATV